jgi:hypothetical protein
LDFQGTTGGVHRTCKFNKSAIACGLDDPTAVFSNLRIYKFAATRLERIQSAFFVDTHEAAVASNVGGEDGG